MATDLDALEAVLAKATPGEWEHHSDEDGVFDPTTIAAGDVPLFASEDKLPESCMMHNAAAIVALHNAAPALIAEHRALLARVEALEGALTEAIERVEKGDLDDQMCCDGHMCGCQGSTVGEQFLYFAKLALEAKP